MSALESVLPVLNFFNHEEESEHRGLLKAGVLRSCRGSGRASQICSKVHFTTAGCAPTLPTGCLLFVPLPAYIEKHEHKIESASVTTGSMAILRGDLTQACLFLPQTSNFLLCFGV